MEKKNHFEDVDNAEILNISEEIILASSPAENTVNDNIINTESAEGSESPVMSKDTPKAERVNEIPTLRGENSRVFRMSDGTEQAVFYAEPIHVFDDETQCFETADTVFADNTKAFVGRKSRFTAEFSKDASNDELFRITDGAHQVTVFSAKAGKHKQHPAVAKFAKSNVNELASASPLTDKLVFEEAEAGADLIYSLIGSGVKENIVIKEKADVYRYSFLLRCENVAAEFEETEQRIAFNDLETGDEVFNIPASFMSDADGNLSEAVSYDCRTLESGDILLTVTADREWINAEERAFPVVIDPQIKVSGAGAMTTYGWLGGHMSSVSSMHTVGTNGDCSSGCNANRMYISLKLPTLPRNPRIKKAELRFFQYSASIQCGCPKLGLYRVTDGISAGICTPVASSDLIDYDTMKSESGDSYSFDITKLADAANKGELSSANLVLKLIDENTSCSDKIMLYGSSCSVSTKMPQLVITYESSYGVNTSYRTHTHGLGRFGRGSIDLAGGNLMFESEDFAWSGNRMPVTIKHLYNSALSSYQYTANSRIKLNTADFTAMKLGYGFKLNVMQSMVSASFQHEGAAYNGYVYIGENGDETYFKQSTKTCPCDSNSQCYNLYENVNGGEMLYDPEKRTLTSGDEVYVFDTNGRLVRVSSGSNSTVITYTSGRISSVTDGAGRVFGFAYNSDGFLTSITAPDGTNVLYTYSGNLLSAVTYPNGRKASIGYSSGMPISVLLSDGDSDVYKVAYTYSGDRVASVTEFGYENGNEVKGAATAYSYSAASRRTIATTAEPQDAESGETAGNVIKTVYAFGDDGNIVSEYIYSSDTGNTGADGEESGINPHSGEGGAGIVSNINNLLVNHSFESLSNWASMPCNCGSFQISNYSSDSYAKFGGKTCWMRDYGTDCGTNGIYQVTNILPVGKYAFSVYARIDGAFGGAENPGVFLRVTDTSDNILAESERISSYDTEYIRLIAPFELTIAKSIKVQILAEGRGSVDIDAAQLENNGFANAYNMLENGNFERGTDGWNTTAGVSYSTGTRFNMSKALYMSGDLDSIRYAYQKVAVKTNSSTRETFTLSGWAKGCGIVERERDNAPLPCFRLRAEIKYKGKAVTETHTADFSPCTDEWQLASVRFAKNEYAQVEYITVYCDYSYNSGSVYFDDIQLVRDSIETDLSASDFTAESSGGAESGETVDEGKSQAADTKPAFEEAKDAFGNALTETTFTDGEFGTIYRSFGFNADNGQLVGNDAGNNLVRETDARGNKTNYTVDSLTSRNEEIADRLGNRTAYEYDASGRTARVTSKKPDGSAIADVAYAYDAFDNMTSITRGDGMKYSLAYNAFHKLEAIGIDGKPDKLIRYDYKNGSGRLRRITYANGDTMKATYDSAGRMVAEKWYDSANTLTAHYKYVYDGHGNIVRSLDILSEIEYTYTYEGGRVARAAESSVALEGETVTARELVNSILYSYDTDGKPTKKRVIPAGGKEQTTYYESPENENTVVKLKAGGRTVTSHSKTDSFGRKVFDELQLGTGFVSRQFHYHAGDVTDEHAANEKLKSSATTQLVSQIVLSGGRTISYEYDAEERITKVTDSVDGVTEYTYDELGQLLTETLNGEAVNTMVYDGYGNIVSKNGIAYTYGDPAWKDLLTAYNGQPITYDAQGNPTSYLGHTPVWEKGRQLKSFDTNTYTYNANGIRTSKTVNGIKHTYTLDGTKILCEAWGGNTLVPLYDNEEGICGIVYNDEPLYFQKNLQSDIIGIVDKNAHTVARYSYDAWGACTVVADASECSVAAVNPFRYRGYYFDVDTSLYYLQSRYYDPVVGRFVNADEATYLGSSGTVLGHNLFVYCENNPVNHEDPIGNWLIQLFCGVAGAAVFGTAAHVLCRLLGANAATRRLITAGFALIGGALGAAFGPALVGRIAPKALAWVNNLEKIINRKSRLRPMLFEGHVAIGWEWDRRFKIMLHFKHESEPEKGMHIAIQHFTGRNWRRTIPDIPIKSLGKVFVNWVKKFLK